MPKPKKASSPKVEALRALDSAIRTIDNETVPIAGLDRRMLRETLMYAQEQIGRIQELQRPRTARKTKARGDAPS